MKGLLVLVAVFFASALSAEAGPTVDWAKVSVEKRRGVEWCLLDAQVTGTLPTSLDRVRAVIEDYAAYPVLFPRIREVQITSDGAAVLLTEVVVIAAMGIVNTNRFTLRITTEPKARSFQSSWTQEKTDGTIDSLEGGWVLEDLGTAEKPLVRVTYRTRSAVPVRIPGQDMVIGMFLGGETKTIVESVFKRALSR